MDAAMVVLVTNVGQGFGRAAALAFGKAGHAVVCADRDVDQASKTAAEIEELGGQAIPVQADMTTHMDVLNTFHKVYEIFGDLHGVVHVVPNESHTRFHTLAENEYAELFDEDLKSTYLTLKVAAQVLAEGWVTVIGPPRSGVEPQMAALRGALAGMTGAFNRRYPRLRCNLLTPSRSPSDPRHDAVLVEVALFVSVQPAPGIGGQDLHVELPPPPRITESLLPEVRAALDSTVRQDDLEASLYDEFDQDGEEAADLDEADDADEGFYDGPEPGPDGQHDPFAGGGGRDEYPEEWEYPFLIPLDRP
jgi:NAD(P)-dependent dehydrogenase (short-subunit alcohol dehydrogenase family)